MALSLCLSPLDSFDFFSSFDLDKLFPCFCRIDEFFKNRVCLIQKKKKKNNSLLEKHYLKNFNQAHVITILIIGFK